MEAQKDKGWIARKNKRSCVISDDEQKLELSLAPPDHQSKPKYQNLPFSSEIKVQQSSVIQWPSESAPNCSLKRSSHSSIIGWPPLRSSRKCFIGSTDLAKTPPKEAMQKGSEGKSDEVTKHHMFVKINMEGVPIGRKIDLKAYDSYHQLSFAIDGLFRGLLAGQRNYSSTENDSKRCNAKAFSNYLCENEEYTLVYEDSEGDRILVGDVPWQMFVTTAKRLRGLKCSEISTVQGSSRGSDKTLLDHDGNW